MGALEAIRVKILVKGEPGRLDALRTELSSESNLFFHYSHDMDEKTFQGLQVRDLGDMVVKRRVKRGPTGVVVWLPCCVGKAARVAISVSGDPDPDLDLSSYKVLSHHYLLFLSC